MGRGLEKRTASSAVLEHEAGGFGDDAGSETVEYGVDERDAVAVLVGAGEVDGVALVVGWAAVVVDFICGMLVVVYFACLGYCLSLE